MNARVLRPKPLGMHHLSRAFRINPLKRATGLGQTG